MGNYTPFFLGDDELTSIYINANLYKRKPITELFLSQRENINSDLLKEKGFVVGMPTSSGKTKVAELNILSVLKEFPNKLCIYIAPYKSLANEIEKSFGPVFEVLNYQVSQLYGGFHNTMMDNRLIENANIIIATPEKVKSLLRSNDQLRERLQLVIVDEGHLVGSDPRHITSELLIEEIKIIVQKKSREINSTFSCSTKY